MKDPILITGAARSGTSMVAGIFNICGAEGGEMSGPNRNNKKGMFENSRIRTEMVKPYLRSIGADPMGQYPLPDLEKMHIPVDWRLRMEQIIKEQGYSGGSWFYKGAKLCLFWPVWREAYPNANYIIVRRKTPDIINSCLKTGFMKAFIREHNQRAVGASNEKDAWLWWVRQHEQRFAEMYEAGLDVKEVWPERMVNGDYTQMKAAVEECGLTWKDKEVREFIEPKLWKAKKK